MKAKKARKKRKEIQLVLSTVKRLEACDAVFCQEMVNNGKYYNAHKMFSIASDK